MKILKKCKKGVIIAMTALMLSSSFAAPVMAHGHCGGGHHGGSTYQPPRKGTYCAYHHKYHAKKKNCKKYCTKHKTTHANGRRHHVKNHHR
ncbi:hypothetical protein AALA36_07230 [Lachnospiraceae bacterium 66-29]